MAQISTTRKLAIAGRIAVQSARKSRKLGALWKGAAATGRSLGRVALRLWHEVTGVIFILFSISGAAAAYHEYHAYRAGAVDAGRERVAAASVFALIFLWFGVSSFWRAHGGVKKK